MSDTRHLSPSDVITYFQPEKCDLRVYLKQHNTKETDPSPFEQVLGKLGERHELQHKESITPIIDVSVGN